MSFARFFPRSGLIGDANTKPTAAAQSAKPDIERLVVQLEDDMRFTMNVIAREADQARARIDEGVEQAERIHVASEQLDAVTIGRGKRQRRSDPLIRTS